MALRPARRILHVCYCCDDAAPVVGDFEGLLGWRKVMSTPMERWDGTTLGLSGEAESAAHFVYDPRGPRTSPAVEVQEWADPPLAGEPPTDPTQAGIQALGVAVPDVGATGWSVVDRTEGWTTVRDPRGVQFDLVEGDQRFRHVRITVTHLDVSVPWWERVGFDVLERGDGVCRLRLPDEPTEVVLQQPPGAHGRHPAAANHAGLFRMALGVDDTRQAYEELLADGVEFDRPPIEVELHGTPVPDMWICFLSDPDGVPVEFVQRPRSAFR